MRSPRTKKSPCKPRRVYVALNLSENAGRRILSGILRFVNSGHRWQLNIANDFAGINAPFVRTKLGTDFDGVIGGLPELSNAFAELLSSDVPFVLNVVPESLPCPESRIRRTVFADVDNAAIGRAAFDYLSCRANFLATAFISDRAERKWSIERESAYVKRWAARGIRAHTFKVNSDERPFDASSLDDFLMSLPKPAAVWCVYDMTAVAVLEACARCKIKVPEQLAILGTDNDETLCKYATPTISSIELPQEQLGFLAAQQLDRLMSGRKPSRTTILTDNGTLKIIERESTRHIPPATHLVAEAVDFISAHVCDRLSVADVAKHLGVSRSLLDLRFRQITGKSVGRTINDAKIKEIKRRLKYTDSPLSQIATCCAFSSVQRLAHFFKHETGLTMSEYRTGIDQPPGS